MRNLFSPQFAIGLLVIFLVAIVSTTFWITRGSSNDLDRIRIENKTRLSVESVISSEAIQPGQSPSRFTVTVKNNYDKPVVAYSWLLIDSLTGKDTISGVEKSGLLNGWSLLPKNTDKISISVASKGEVVLTLAAVLFEDGTGDGETDELARLQDIRTGVKSAYQQILPLFHQASIADESVPIDTAFQMLENKVSSISDEQVPVNSKRGFAEAKNYLKQELKDLKDKLRSNPSLRRDIEITNKYGKIERTLAKM